jgi:mono/diheme cytochrome c family protein
MVRAEESSMKLSHFYPAILCISGALCAVFTGAHAADAPKPVPAHGPATIKELMTLVVEPASNGIFQAGGEPPKTEAQWKTLQGQALTLLELANTLSAANRAKDKGQWLTDAKAFQVESKKAFDAAMAKNVDALMTISDSLYETCAGCHGHYLPKN